MLACTRWQWERGMMDENYTTEKEPGILLFHCSMPSHIFYRSSVEGNKYLLQRFNKNLKFLKRKQMEFAFFRKAKNLIFLLQ
jgi:hypothetical protein